MPKVSVILSSYNHEKFISRAIESVLNQTFKDFELNIWDDCSTDNSYEIIKSYALKDKRIKIEQSKVNSATAFFTGKLKTIKSKYVAIHHSDDDWHPKKLEKQVDFLENNPKYSAVFSHVKLIDDDGKKFNDSQHHYYKIFDQPNRTRHEWLNYFFYRGNCLCHPSLLIRKKCYDEAIYDSRFAQLPDFDFWIRLCLKHEIYILQEKLTLFRIHKDGSNTSAATVEVLSRAAIELVEVLKNYLKINDKGEFIKVFPQYKAMKINERLIPFYIAQEAIKLSESHQLFAAVTLFDLMKNEKELLEKELNFTYKDLKQITKSIDPFNKRQLTEMERTIKDLKKTLEWKIIKFVFFPRKILKLLKEKLPYKRKKGKSNNE
jgi:glycosyltransferase involved in cell wall biosynthesis